MNLTRKVLAVLIAAVVLVALLAFLAGRFTARSKVASAPVPPKVEKVEKTVAKKKPAVKATKKATKPVHSDDRLTVVVRSKDPVDVQLSVTQKDVAKPAAPGWSGHVNKRVEVPSAVPCNYVPPRPRLVQYQPVLPAERFVPIGYGSMGQVIYGVQRGFNVGGFGPGQQFIPTGPVIPPAGYGFY
jgi:hypothetical protein